MKLGYKNKSKIQHFEIKKTKNIIPIRDDCFKYDFVLSMRDNPYYSIKESLSYLLLKLYFNQSLPLIK